MNIHLNYGFNLNESRLVKKHAYELVTTGDGVWVTNNGVRTQVISQTGKLLESAGIELSDGDSFLDNNGNEVVEFGVVASAVNQIGITNAATGNNPIISAEGEADTGITFQNKEAEEILILDSVATSVNEFTVSSAATGNGPQLAATGGDTDINIELIPKGVGYVDIQNGGLQVVAQTVTPNNDSGTASTIEDGAIHVDVAAVTNNADDWIVLPPLANVPVGHTIKIACNAGGNFEMRTPASSNEKINTVDSDGTQEYLCTDTELITVTKVSDADGWVATAQTALGAIATAVVPD